MTSATGTTTAPLIAVRSLPDAVHELPDGFHGHGLNGRDDFTGLVLTIDLSQSIVQLRPPRRWWRLWW
jgi:hypothetical protein